MAVCEVCGGIFDNVDGTCPSCGAAVGGSSSDQSADALYDEAHQRINAEQVADAKGLLTQAIKKDDSKGEYHFFLGSVLYKLGEFPTAYSTWQKADRMLPGQDRIQKCLVAARQRMTEQER